MIRARPWNNRFLPYIRGVNDFAARAYDQQYNADIILNHVPNIDAFYHMAAYLPTFVSYFLNSIPQSDLIFMQVHLINNDNSQIHSRRFYGNFEDASIDVDGFIAGLYDKFIQVQRGGAHYMPATYEGSGNENGFFDNMAQQIPVKLVLTVFAAGQRYTGRPGELDPALESEAEEEEEDEDQDQQEPEPRYALRPRGARFQDPAFYYPPVIRRRRPRQRVVQVVPQQPPANFAPLPLPQARIPALLPPPAYIPPQLPLGPPPPVIAPRVPRRAAVNQRQLMNILRASRLI